MRLFSASIILAFLPAAAWSLPIVHEQGFTYEGTCSSTLVTRCAFIGLNNGDPVSGLITFVDDDENRVIEAREIIGWDFAFGNALFGSSSHWLSGALALNADGTGFGGALVEGLFFTPLTNGVGTTYSGVTGSLFFGALDGWVVRACRGHFCGSASGSGTYTKVSEPGTLMLLGVGLIATVVARRRRTIDGACRPM